MTRDRIKRIYDLHSWIGITCGLFIYVVSLSGVFALFGEELHAWEDEQLRIDLPTKPYSADALLQRFLAEITRDASLVDLSLGLPTALEPFYSATAGVRTYDGGAYRQHYRRWHPQTGEPLQVRGDGFVHWIVYFHRNLMLPRTLGRALVGLSGMLMLVLIFSGIVVHRKFLTEAFTWRLHRSVRLKWQDSHKAMALWGLPFNVMIAFTGAWLGFIIVLLPVAAMVSFEGDAGAVIEAVSAPSPEPSGTPAPMISLDAAVRSVSRQMGMPPDYVEIKLLGDSNAVYRFFFTLGDTLAGYTQVDVAAASGRIAASTRPGRPGLPHQIPAAVTTLHYADFGGLWMKLLYTILGLFLCIVTATGMMMWLERRLHGNEGRRPEFHYRLLSRVVVGICAGMGLTNFAIFHADKLIEVTAESRLAAIGWIYFAIWAAALLYALLRGNDYRACKELLAATALTALAIPLTNAAVTGQNTWQFLSNDHPYAAGTDMAAFATGLGLSMVSKLIPAQRPGKSRAAVSPDEEPRSRVLMD